MVGRGLRLQNECVGFFSSSCLLEIYRDARVDRESNCGKHVWLILNCFATCTRNQVLLTSSSVFNESDKVRQRKLVAALTAKKARFVEVDGADPANAKFRAVCLLVDKFYACEPCLARGAERTSHCEHSYVHEPGRSSLPLVESTANIHKFSFKTATPTWSLWVAGTILRDCWTTTISLQTCSELTRIFGLSKASLEGVCLHNKTVHCYQWRKMRASWPLLRPRRCL